MGISIQFFSLNPADQSKTFNWEQYLLNYDCLNKISQKKILREISNKSNILNTNVSPFPKLVSWVKIVSLIWYIDIYEARTHRCRFPLSNQHLIISIFDWYSKRLLFKLPNTQLIFLYLNLLSQMFHLSDITTSHVKEIMLNLCRMF